MKFITTSLSSLSLITSPLSSDVSRNLLSRSGPSVAPSVANRRFPAITSAENLFTTSVPCLMVFSPNLSFMPSFNKSSPFRLSMRQMRQRGLLKRFSLQSWMSSNAVAKGWGSFLVIDCRSTPKAISVKTSMVRRKYRSCMSTGAPEVAGFALSHSTIVLVCLRAILQPSRNSRRENMLEATLRCAFHTAPSDAKIPSPRNSSNASCTGAPLT
mmetsp:Transcript_48012/g.134080  ORF Transcript_48012/g.134080 Transcript_48012/m.134080 type:complete len:213 (+) Transcript_48012:557-1195(+)